MDDTDPPLPADLRFLKVLTITLMAVMILGLIAIVWLLVTRLGAAPVLPTLPESVILPQGAIPSAVTFAQDWLVVVTQDGTVLLYSADGGEPASVTPLPAASTNQP